MLEYVFSGAEVDVDAWPVLFSVDGARDVVECVLAVVVGVFFRDNGVELEALVVGPGARMPTGIPLASRGICETMTGAVCPTLSTMDRVPSQLSLSCSPR